MTPEQFVYWLQGFAELQQTPPTSEQWKGIQDHLNLVLTRVTPRYAPNNTPPPGIVAPPTILPGGGLMC